MYTSVVLVALSGSVVASYAAQDLAWQTDYAQARKMGETQRKPLAVFIGSGATGYDKVCRDGKLSAEVQKLLADNYICVYVDASTPAGEKLVKELAMTQWLRRFADPNVVVRTTVVNDDSRVSMYYSPNGANGFASYAPNGYMNGYQPYGYQPAMWYGGGGCAGGNCGGGRRR